MASFAAEELVEGAPADAVATLSPAFKCTSGVARLSPCGFMVASVLGHRVYVRRAQDDLELLHVWSCVDAVDKLAWSPDGKRVLVASRERGVVEIFCVGDETWRCRISEGIAGVARAAWAPDSLHVVTVADFGMHLSIWSLADESVAVVERPKQLHGTERCFAWSGDGAFIAVLTREGGHDGVRVVGKETWDVVAEFKPQSRDAVSIAWSRDDGTLYIVEDPVQYEVLCYSPLGQLQTRYRAYENALGVTAHELAPAAPEQPPQAGMLALGSFDNCLRLLNLLTFTTTAEYPLAHPRRVGMGKLCEDFELYVEQNDGSFSPDIDTRLPTPAPALRATSQSKKDAESGTVRPEGVTSLEWSSCGRYLAALSSRHPTCAFVYDTGGLGLKSLVVCRRRATNIAWCPDRPRLLLQAGRLFFLELAAASPTGEETLRELPLVDKLRPGEAFQAHWRGAGADGLLIVSSRQWMLADVGGGDAPRGEFPSPEPEREPKPEP